MPSILRFGLLSAVLASAGAAHANLVSTLPGSPLSPPVTVSFSNTNVTAGPGAGAGYNFIDQWNFVLSGAADTSAITTTFDFGAGPGGPTFGISDLQVRLVGSLGTLVSWLTVTPIGPGFTSSVALVPLSPLAAGSYHLDVRGNVGATGAYGGTVIASPVPLPAALPLLLVGLGALGLTGKRHRRPDSRVATGAA